MKQLAEGLYQLSGFPPNGINVYLMGDVLVDAGTRHSGRRIFRQIEGHRVATHALPESCWPEQTRYGNALSAVT